MSEGFKVQAEHLIFLACLLEEQSNEDHWSKLSETFLKCSQARAWFLEVCPVKTSLEKTAYYSEAERMALAISYREEAERIFLDDRAIYWPTVRGKNLNQLARLYIIQKRYEEASETLRKSAISMKSREAAELLTTIQNFEASFENIRAVIFGLSQKEANAKQKLRAIELATKHGCNPLIKADLAKIFFSSAPSEENETAFRILNEAQYTDHLELAVFMAQRYTSDGNDEKAFYWWAIAISAGLQNLPESLRAFIKHVTDEYPDCKEVFTVPVYFFQSDIQNLRNIETQKVENFYLATLAVDENSPESNIYQACRDIVIQLANDRESKKSKNPSLHRWASELYARDESYSLAINESCLFIDQLDIEDDYVLKDWDVIERQKTAEEVFWEIIESEISSMHYRLKDHHEECGAWWEGILEAKNPERFKSLFNFEKADNYLKAMPKRELLTLYRLINNLPHQQDEVSLEEEFPGLSDTARSHLPGAW